MPHPGPGSFHLARFCQEGAPVAAAVLQVITLLELLLKEVAGRLFPQYWQVRQIRLLSSSEAPTQSIKSHSFVTPLCCSSSALRQMGANQVRSAKLPPGKKSPEDQRERQLLAEKTPRWINARPVFAWMFRDLLRQAESCRGPPPRLEGEVQSRER